MFLPSCPCFHMLTELSLQYDPEKGLGASRYLNTWRFLEGGEPEEEMEASQPFSHTYAFLLHLHPL